MPRDLSCLSRDFKVELTLALRSISEGLLLSKCVLRRGERLVVSEVVGKTWEHEGLNRRVQDEVVNWLGIYWGEGGRRTQLGGQSWQRRGHEMER